MPGVTILGSGKYLPGKPVPNAALARVMDTNDGWIRQRTGIEQRHFASDEEGASDLAVPACRMALEAAGLKPEHIDYVLFNTMTPDYAFPGSGALLAHKLGLVDVPALDLRQQCAAIPFSLQLADALVNSGAARHVLLVCAEAHAGIMPWRDWDLLDAEGSAVAPLAAEGRASEASEARGGTERAPDDRFAEATRHRGFSVLFGDGAGALVLGKAESSKGFLGARVYTDGGQHGAIRLAAGGFRRRPFVSADTLAREEHVPQMDGRGLFRSAVQRLPQAIREVLRACDSSLEDVDWFIAHQANERINQAVKEALRVPDEKVPSNIARYGNTSSATIPILVDELLRDGRLRRGQLACFFALGAGLNWGAALMRL